VYAAVRVVRHVHRDGQRSVVVRDFAKAIGRGVEIRALRNSAKRVVYDCTQTDRHACEQGALKFAIAYNLTFPDLPKVLKMGDRIDFEGTVKATSKLSSDHTRTTLDIDGEIIRNVKRAKRKDEDPEYWGAVVSY
jgi:hypothetical protein